MIILVFTLAILYLLVLITCLFRWYKYWLIVEDKSLSDPLQLPTVTVLISVKNEEKQIRKCVEAILQQDYPIFDIILVDDHSSDRTLSTCEEIAYTHENVSTISLPAAKTGKKASLTAGILKSMSDWILMTDADCLPESNTWLRSMMVQHERLDVVVGVSPYRLNKKSLLSSLITYEGVLIALDYLIAIQEGRAYMAVGRNLAIRRQTFLVSDGFSRHEDLASGSDDLLVQSIRDLARIGFTSETKSLVWSKPKTSCASYLRQKKRHMTTSWRYGLEVKLRLMTQHFSYAAFYILPTMLSILLSNAWILFCVFIAIALKCILLRRAFRQWQLSTLVWRTIYLDIGLLIFYVILAASKPLKRDVW